MLIMEPWRVIDQWSQIPIHFEEELDPDSG